MNANYDGTGMVRHLTLNYWWRGNDSNLGSLNTTYVSA